MAKTLEEIANALMGALYGVVSQSLGDESGSGGAAPFVAWNKPGVPFEPEDFRFAKNMLIGQGASEEERMADFLFQSTQAAGFSRYVDFVPSVNGVVGGNISAGVLRPGSAQLSSIYKKVLDSAQIAEIPQPAEIDAKIAALAEKAKPMEAPYTERAATYNDAKAELDMARARAGFSAEGKLEFQVKGASLKAKVTRAKQSWEVSGFKTPYENIQAEIQSLRSKRSPALWLKEAIDNYDTSSRGEDATFGEARLTMPFPGSFAENENGWTDFKLEMSNVDKLSKAKSSKFGASGGVGWGSFKIGGSAAGSTTQTLTVNNTNGFTLKMKIAQIPLLRDWFDPWFLRSEFWRFKAGSIEAERGDVVSDGAAVPSGLLIAYPVSAIFVRKIEITMDELKDESSELVKTLKAEAKVGWGFGALNAGGSYERNNEVRTQKTDLANGVLKVDGMQLIGFLCETMDKSPDPKASLKFVGGN
jgi:hypothetical protein